MENLLKNIEDLRVKILRSFELLRLTERKAEAKDLREQMNAADFWSDRERAVSVGKRVEELESETRDWDALLSELDSIKELALVSQSDADESLLLELEASYAELYETFSRLEFFVLFNGAYDQGNAIVSIHAGTGGVDAMDFASMLERMYFRFAEKKSWRVELLDRVVGAEAGIKSVSFSVSGRWAFGHLRGEAGVHRLVRISPFDGEAMRQTSFALVEVIPELPETEDVEIKDSDLRIDVYRSSGAGGQHVNTTDSAVRLTHLATGIVVTCQSERSQHQNKDRAMRVLKAKLFKLKLEERQKEQSDLKGAVQKAEWGRQIRSYVLQPYRMVKDHRTECETADTDAVLDGKLDEFVEAWLKHSRQNQSI